MMEIIKGIFHVIVLIINTTKNNSKNKKLVYRALKKYRLL